MPHKSDYSASAKRANSESRKAAERAIESAKKNKIATWDDLGFREVARCTPADRKPRKTA